MRFTPFVLAAIAGLAIAGPVTSLDSRDSDIEKRGLLVIICEAACASLCGVGTPLACLACAAACLETGLTDGTVTSLGSGDLAYLANLTAAVATA